MNAAALPPPRIVIGDCREALRQFPDGHFQSVITSPPYWGARVYADSEAWTGGDPKCNHGQKCREWALYRQGNEGRERPDFQSRTLGQGAIGKYYRHDCPACGAQRADTPMGLEKIPDCLAWARDEPPCGECYTCNIVEVIAECARVLADDGVMFWNFGDSYCSGKSRHAAVAHTMSGKERGEPTEPGRKPDTRGHPVFRDTQLALIPHRVALAAQHRIGLLVRNDIIWWKPNGMPESSPTRCTTAHEHIWLFAKSAKYKYNCQNCLQPYAEDTPARLLRAVSGEDKYAAGGHDPSGKPHHLSRPRPNITGAPGPKQQMRDGSKDAGGGTGIAAARERAAQGVKLNPKGVPLRDVWPMATANDKAPQVFKCPACGKHAPIQFAPGGKEVICIHCKAHSPAPIVHFAAFPPELPRRALLLSTDPGDRVLDPFAGTGTTLRVAAALGRVAIGVENSPQYAALAAKRLKADAGALFAE